MEAILGRHWHHLPLREVLEILETNSEEGLDTFELGHRERRFGPNRLSERKAQGPFIRFLLQFHQPLIYMLLAASIITAALQEWVDAAVIFGVVLANALIGFVQESNAVKAILALSRTLDSESLELPSELPTTANASPMPIQPKRPTILVTMPVIAHPLPVR